MTKRTMYRYLKYLLLVFVGVAIGFFVKGKFFSHAGPMGMGGAGQASVLVKTLEKKPVALGKNFIARVEAINATDVVPQVSGYIDQVLFQDGSFVNEGEVLFIIDQKRYKAAVSSAEATLDKSNASLKQIQSDYNRELALYKDHMLSQADLELAESNLANAKANVKAAKAALDLAKLDLAYTEVKSPIAGYIGKALMTKGNLATAGASKLARVVQMDPIRVVFSITDKERLSGMDQITNQNTRPDIQIALPNGQTIEMPEANLFADNEINAQTATMAVYAQTDNKENKLIPGNHVNVTVSLDKLRPMILIPQTALAQDATGQYVMTVNSQGVVVQQYVKTGDVVNGNVVVVSGLQAGDRVVTIGQQKLQNGQQVNVSEVNMPEASPKAQEKPAHTQSYAPATAQTVPVNTKGGENN
ncbi:MAG: efflux RND transporter periplasmic adaptor subunit [Elusimicrobiaceae bacterium]|nr:efflux RND transporter periplasmic adaptor subunit [Elusimicrobiaceae bacterium]